MSWFTVVFGKGSNGIPPLNGIGPTAKSRSYFDSI
jgi:hypothetical protein